MPVTVCFCHGRESGPWGHKISALAEVARGHGATVVSPDFRFTMDPDERARFLLEQGLPSGGGLLLAGSSMGGYVAAAASQRLTPGGLFLLAPAVDIPGYTGDTTPGSNRVEVVHGWGDAIVPVDAVSRWARRHRARLHVLDSDHTLNDHIPWLCHTFDRFLRESAPISAG